MVRFRLLPLLICWAAWSVAGSLPIVAQQVADGSRDRQSDIAFFENKIRPVLVEHCYRCHAAGAEKIKAGLLLDTRAGIRRGGESGPSVVPHDPDESLILAALRHESFEMPPDRRLPDHVIADFEHWIQTGAADPRGEPSIAPLARTINVDEGRKFWSFQPVTAPAPPAVRSSAWPLDNVDRFLLAEMERVGLEPVDDADRETLVRRVYYALVGLPPSPDEIEGFVHHPSPLSIALADVIDRLLESPRYGERWGRHWLDVVRFAESSGGGRTLLFPDAWRYRDYVIDSFNDDVPFDRFVTEQIAGDLLPAADWKQKSRHLTATAFLVLGPTNYELQDKDVLEADVVDEQLDTLGKSLLGMTLGCARCHDHKFDPIPAHDYYAMAGILRSTQAIVHDNVSAWTKVDLPVDPQAEAVIQQHKAKVKALREQLGKAKQQLGNQSPQPELLEASAESVVGVDLEIETLENAINQLERTGPARPVAMAVKDHKLARDIPLAVRGMEHNPGPVIPRGMLQVATTASMKFEIPANASGRRQLADWIVASENPLTARVIVNRVWHWLFGEGLVATTDNFGATGRPPSHPQLLDHLAHDFMEDGWSIKRLVRRLMLTRAYRLRSDTIAEADSDADTDRHAVAARLDPGNRLRWRMTRVQMDAESLRDTLLSLGGSLDNTMGGPNIAAGTQIEYGYQFNSVRRSVYVPVFRNTLPNLFAVFDFADPNIQTGKRTQSTIAPQALLLMNHPFVIEQSRLAARRLLSERAADVNADGLVRQTFLSTLGRQPSRAESQLAIEFVGGETLSVEETAVEETAVVRWGMLIQTLIQSIDFRYLR